MSNLTELGTAAWRLRKWVQNAKEERKMPAISALKSIDRYLKENNVEVIDPTGSQFDVGLAVSVVNNESENTNEEEFLIIDTIKPIVMVDGSVQQYGQVVLGDAMPRDEETAEILTAESKSSETDEQKSEEIPVKEKQPVTKFDWIVRIVSAAIILGALILLDIA